MCAWAVTVAWYAAYVVHYGRAMGRISGDCDINTRALTVKDLLRLKETGDLFRGLNPCLLAAFILLDGVDCMWCM